VFGKGKREVKKMEAVQHYRAYKPRPLKKEDRRRVTLLFGGLTWKHERLMQGTLENCGYRAMPLPNIEREDLDIGKEFIDTGACCPTTFTAGNLARFLMKKVREEGPEKLKENYVFVTVGACGPCRFGQYHESYERVLEGLDLRDFRIFLLDLLQMEQSEGGLEITMPLTFGLIYSMFIGDLLTDLEYATRPYEVVPGETDRVLKESVELLYERFKNRPLRGEKWGSLLWHITTPYFVKALREVRELWNSVEVDRLRPKPRVKITGEFWLQTHEGDGNYNIKRWLEREGAEVIPPPIAIWMDYLIHMELWRMEEEREFIKNYRLKKAVVKLLLKLYHFTYNRLRRALANIPNPLPPQEELRELAKPFFHFRLAGGEGHMLIGKALYAYRNKHAHMICELSPYGCMPNTMSVGAMQAVLGKHPDLLYAPIEIKGDAEVHALSRCQMILTEAKMRAKKEFEEALERTGLTIEDIRSYEEDHPELKRAMYRVPHYGYACTGANYIIHVAKLMGRG
jgi:predicted nucleotide-binding protein (sugar kinase/HSP70/actin superfamily)